MNATGDATRTTATNETHVHGVPLPSVTDETMRERLAGTQAYTAAVLRKTSTCISPDVDPIIWEHGRRNFALREHGSLSIVLPVTDDSEWAGVYIFTGTPDEVSEILDHDPGVKAGIFTYELHPGRGFPGSTLP